MRKTPLVATGNGWKEQRDPSHQLTAYSDPMDRPSALLSLHSTPPRVSFDFAFVEAVTALPVPVSAPIVPTKPQRWGVRPRPSLGVRWNFSSLFNALTLAHKTIYPGLSWNITPPDGPTPVSPSPTSQPTHRQSLTDRTVLAQNYASRQ